MSDIAATQHEMRYNNKGNLQQTPVAVLSHPRALRLQRSQSFMTDCTALSIPFKTCNKCGMSYPATAKFFYCDNGAPDGFFRWCKGCEKLRRRNYYLKNRKRELEKNRQYYEAHRDEISERKAQYYQENRRKLIEYSRQWAKDNPEKLRKRTQRYRARTYGASGEHSGKDILLIGERQGWRCWYCQSDCRANYHIEHRIPLSRGGSNDPGNLVVACPKCNLSKGNKLPHEWCGRLL